MRGVAWLGVCGGLVAVPAWAHNFAPERELQLQVDGQGLVLFWSFQLSGAPAQAMVGSHDLDRDGALSVLEQTTLALALLSKAQSGVTLRQNDLALPGGKLTPRLQTDGNSVRALGLMEYPPTSSGAVAPTMQITVAVATTAAPLGMTVRALSPCRLQAVTGGKEDHDHGLMLLPGMTLAVTLACVPEEAAPQP